MPKYRLCVLTRPKPGREAEYHEWYDTVHIPDVLAIPGYRSAQRFKMAHVVSAADPSPYLALYELETDDVTEVLAESRRRAEQGSMVITDALDREASYTVFYEEMGPKIEA